MKSENLLIFDGATGTTGRAEGCFDFTSTAVRTLTGEHGRKRKETHLRQRFLRSSTNLPVLSKRLSATAQPSANADAWKERNSSDWPSSTENRNRRIKDVSSWSR